VVIAIIGLLSTLAVVSLNGARAKARDAKRLSDVKQISTLIEMAATNNPSGSYGDVASAVFPTTCDTIAVDFRLPANACVIAGTDIAAITDPSAAYAAVTPNVCADGSAGVCNYTLTLAEYNSVALAVDTDDYEICFYLENGFNGGQPGSYSISKGGIIKDTCCSAADACNN
jgi:type II secretory pathway pseudopilin PulG